MMSRPLKNNLTVSVFFASFMFLQFFVLRMGNSAGRGYLPVEKQEKVYVFLQLFVILGILFHAALREIIKERAKVAVVVSLSACLAGALFMLFLPADSAPYLVITFATVFCLGFDAGAVYYMMSRFAASGIRVGIAAGAGYSAALALQFALQLEWNIKAALVVAACLSFLSLVLAVRRDEGAVKKPEPSVKASRIAVCSVTAAALLLFTSFYSGYIHRLQIASGYTEYNVYSWPRLLMIPGMLAFGALGDFRGGKYLPLAAVCTSALAFLNAVLAGNADMYFANMCLYYVALSAAVSYYNITFWKIAPRTAHPAVWSAAGRVIDSVVVIPLCLVSLSEASAGVVLALNIAALAAVIVVMALGGDLDLSVKAEGGSRGEASGGAFSVFCAKYGLTAGEARVLRELVTTENKQAAIAENLSVKIRTVQANVTSIYRKTGVSTRSGLLKLYHEIKDRR